MITLTKLQYSTQGCVAQTADDSLSAGPRIVHSLSETLTTRGSWCAINQS
jgi:hypothetical protein